MSLISFTYLHIFIFVCNVIQSVERDDAAMIFFDVRGDVEKPFVLYSHGRILTFMKTMAHALGLQDLGDTRGGAGKVHMLQK